MVFNEFHPFVDSKSPVKAGYEEEDGKSSLTSEDVVSKSAIRAELDLPVDDK